MGLVSQTVDFSGGDVTGRTRREFPYYVPLRREEPHDQEGQGPSRGSGGATEEGCTSFRHPSFVPTSHTSGSFTSDVEPLLKTSWLTG